MRTLKYFGGDYCGISRRIVSTYSHKRASELLKISLYEFNQHYCETGNTFELELLKANPPETVFESSKFEGWSTTGYTWRQVTE